MSVLLGLPDELIRCILSEWIEVQEWGLLDISFSSAKLRPPFLSLVSSSTFQSNSLLYQGLIEFYQWTNRRNVKVTSFHLADVFFEEYPTNMKFIISLDSVLSLNVCGLSRRYWKIVGCCPNLIHFVCDYCDTLECLSLEVLKQLKTLAVTFEYLNDMDFEFITTVQTSSYSARLLDCVSLETVKYVISEEYDSTAAEIMEHLMFNNTCLKSITIFHQTNLASLYGRCSQLTFLDLRVSSFSLSLTASILLDCPGLNTLIIAEAISIYERFRYEKAGTLKINGETCFEGVSIDIDDWERFSDAIHNLTEVSIKYIDEEGMNSVLNRLATNSQNTLTSVCIAQCTKLEFESLSMFLDCPFVTKLDLDIRSMPITLFTRFLNVSTKLTHITLMAKLLGVDSLLLLLEHNHYLCYCKFVNVDVRTEENGTKLTNCIQNYRNRDQHPLICTLFLRRSDCDYHILVNYDGNKFIDEDD